MVEPYIPNTGHIVWLSLDPQLGREQAGRRPFLVLSPSSYNAKTSLVVGAPITSKVKGYPFEVSLGTAGPVFGVVLADQIKSLDWRAREAEFAAESGPEVVPTLRSILSVFLGIV